MNGLDYLIIALASLGAIYGISRGALRMVTSVVSLLAGLYVASLHYSWASAIAQSQLGVGPTTAAALGYAVVFAAVFVAVEFAGSFAGRVLRTVHLGWVDRLGGGALGAGIACAVAGLCAMVMAAVLPVEAPLLRQSQLAPYVLRYTEVLIGYVPAKVKDAYFRKRADLFRYWVKRTAAAASTAVPSPSASHTR
jgi:membrane protein required for colicin V production